MTRHSEVERARPASLPALKPSDSPGCLRLISWPSASRISLCRKDQPKPGSQLQFPSLPPSAGCRCDRPRLGPPESRALLTNGERPHSISR
jgi:hypothetical protein